MMTRLCLSISLLLTQSCATIMNKNNRNLEVTATPSNSSVKYRGNNYGPAPTKVAISGYKILSGPTVSVEKKGYITQTREVPTTFQGWTIVSFLLGILPGIVDVATGNIYRLDANKMHFNLIKEEVGENNVSATPSSTAENI